MKCDVRVFHLMFMIRYKRIQSHKISMRSSMRIYTSSERVSQFLSPLHADSQTFFMFKLCASPISQVFLVFVNCIVFNNIIRHHAFLPISFPIFLRFRTISIQIYDFSSLNVYYYIRFCASCAN